VEVREVGGMRQVINLDSEEEEAEGSIPPNPFYEQERDVATPPIYEQEVNDNVTKELVPELSEFTVCEYGAATTPISEQVMIDVVTQEPASEQAIPENIIFEDTTTTPVCEQEMTDAVKQELV
jgi:hypothetical protein